MMLFNLKHWKTQILSKGSTLNQPEASKKNCQGHPTNLLAKQLKISCNESNDFEFSNVSEKILLSLNTSKAVGMDQIPAQFLRDGAEVFPLPLGNIKLSIKLSTLPEECKIAKLKLIFKKGARTDLKNYCPISLLPLVSKIIEKSIHFQIEDYLNKKKLIYMYQSGSGRTIQQIFVWLS